ncbi:MAG: UbiA prenyltransferase family protein [Planctomycetota bacterium]|nr:UbiA prenyltransferase family protein [Planctomycetota bacterium]
MTDSNEQLIATSARRGLGAIFEAMRLPHWIKNAFVVAPILFAGRFNDLGAWGLSLAAVAAFCLLSSAAYLINDVCDRKNDRAHPLKRHRPVAEGRLSPTAAGGAGVLLAAGGLGIAVAVAAVGYDPAAALGGLGLVVWAGGYLLLNLLYSFWLKSHAVVDVIAVAMCFVLRAMAGAAAICVPVSPWLVVCTFSLCLFIALAKRRSELIELDAGCVGTSRPLGRSYDRRDLDYMLTVSTGLAILTYSLYCLAPRTVSQSNIGSAHMVWTIPLVVYGMFRYHRLTQQPGGGDPVSLLLRDRAMWAVLIVYVALASLIVRYGAHPSVRAVLDVEGMSK